MLGGKSWWLLGAVVAGIVVVGVAPAAVGGAGVCPRATGCMPQFEVDADVKVSPMALPKARRAPVRIGINAGIKQGPRLALREAELTAGDDLAIDAEGLPVCGRHWHRDGRGVRRRDGLRRAEKVCGRSIVGRGKARFSIAFPGQPRYSPASRIILLNGGIRRGTLVLFALAEIRGPAPQTLLATIAVRPRPGHGWVASLSNPLFASGFGALTDVRLTVGRHFTRGNRRKSLLSARCPDGKFRLSARKLVFMNDANLPGAAFWTVVRGRLNAPCKPKG